MAIEMYVHNGVRYALDDAERLGLITRGAVRTVHSERMERTTSAPEGLLNSEVLNPPKVDKAEEEQGGDNTGRSTGPHVHMEVDANRPNNGASKKNWVTYALGVGLTAEQLDGLGRDQIIEAVDAHQGADS